MSDSLPRVFRTSKLLIFFLTVCGAVSGTGAWGLSKTQSGSFTVWMLVVFAAACLLAIIEGCLARVALDNQAITIVSGFRKRRIERAEIERVSQEKGSPLALRLSSGQWFNLPSTISGLHANTLRGWLKRQPEEKR